MFDKKKVKDVDSSGSPETLKQKLNRSGRNKKKKHFERTRMWVYYLSSQFAKDRGKIPANIGGRILISNNMYVTQLYLSSVIQVECLSLSTPVTVMELLTGYLRSKGSHAVVDFTFKNSRLNMNFRDSGLTSRIRTWENVMKNPMVTRKQKESAARCLYTTELLGEGEKLYMTRLYITLRCKLGSELVDAERRSYEFLESIGAEYRLVTPMKDTLSYISMMSDKRSKDTKDFKALCFSDKTLSQMMPNTASHNGYSGLWIGNNILNNSHYLIPFMDITVARNIYVVAPAGVGKTVIAINAAMAALEHPKWRVCMMDIKGNEFSRLAEGCGGLVLSLTPRSKFYINGWKMNPDSATHDGAQDYFSSNVNFSKKKMITLSGANDKETRNEEDELLEEFHNSVYNSLGVLPNNKNTWYKTEGLDPFTIYEMLEEYITPQVQKKYPLGARKLINGLKTYMSRSGSKAFVFSDEFDMASILKAKCIVFNFGMLKYTEVSQIDQDLFDSKFDDMSKINSEYVQYNYAHDLETFKVLEESQVVPPKTRRKYVEEVTVRRSQRQTTWVLGNSVQALVSDKEYAPLIENIRGILMGDLPGESREQVIKQFDLQQYRPLIKLVGSSEKFSNSFIFINRMQPDPLIPILKLNLEKGKKYLMFTPTKSVDDEEDLV